MSADEPAPAPDPAPARPARATDVRTRLTGVIVVGMSVAVWWPAFTLGAWGEPFFDQMLTVWAASTAALLVVLLQRRARRRVRRCIALAVPSLWLALTFIPLPDDIDENVLASVVLVLSILVALFALPVTILVLARIIWPEFGEDISWRRRALVLGAVGVIAVASFLLGVNQAEFLTCNDFTLSGNSEPPGCTPSEP